MFAMTPWMYYLFLHNDSDVHFDLLGVCYNVFSCLFWNRENKGFFLEKSYHFLTESIPRTRKVDAHCSHERYMFPTKKTNMMTYPEITDMYPSYLRDRSANNQTLAQPRGQLIKTERNETDSFTCPTHHPPWGWAPPFRYVIVTAEKNSRASVQQRQENDAPTHYTN
jgi:hypothetical protein